MIFALNAHDLRIGAAKALTAFQPLMQSALHLQALRPEIHPHMGGFAPWANLPVESPWPADLLRCEELLALRAPYLWESAISWFRETP